MEEQDCGLTSIHRLQISEVHLLREESEGRSRFAGQVVPRALKRGCTAGCRGRCMNSRGPLSRCLKLNNTRSIRKRGGNGGGNDERCRGADQSLACSVEQVDFSVHGGHAAISADERVRIVCARIRALIPESKSTEGQPNVVRGGCLPQTAHNLVVQREHGLRLRRGHVTATDVQKAFGKEYHFGASTGRCLNRPQATAPVSLDVAAAAHLNHRDFAWWRAVGSAEGRYAP